MRRIILFAGLITAGFLFPWWVFGALSFFYALKYRSYELIVLGLLLDAVSGISGFLAPFPYVYIVMTLAASLLGDIARPRIAIFGRSDEAEQWY